MTKTKMKTVDVIKADGLDAAIKNDQPLATIRTTQYEVVVQDAVDSDFLPKPDPLQNETYCQVLAETNNRYKEVNDILDACEKDLENTGATIGKLLHEIKTKGLYHAEYKSFEEYLDNRREKIYRGTAERLINEYEVKLRLIHEAQEWGIDLTEMPSQNAAQHLHKLTSGATLLSIWMKQVKKKETKADQVKEAVDNALGVKPKSDKPPMDCRAVWKLPDAPAEVEGWKADKDDECKLIAKQFHLNKIYSALRAMIDYCEQNNIRPVVSCR